MSEEKKVEKTQVQILCDAFEGMKGRRPKSDQELNELICRKYDWPRCGAAWNTDESRWSVDRAGPALMV